MGNDSPIAQPIIAAAAKRSRPVNIGGDNPDLGKNCMSMNGSVRQYLPKGTDLAGYTEQQLMR